MCLLRFVCKNQPYFRLVFYHLSFCWLNELVCGSLIHPSLGKLVIPIFCRAAFSSYWIEIEEIGDGSFAN